MWRCDFCNACRPSIYVYNSKDIIYTHCCCTRVLLTWATTFLYMCRYDSGNVSHVRLVCCLRPGYLCRFHLLRAHYCPLNYWYCICCCDGLYFDGYVQCVHRFFGSVLLMPSAIPWCTWNATHINLLRSPIFNTLRALMETTSQPE